MADIQDIYPLSPLQQGMLYHTLSAEQLGIYASYVRYTLKGNLDIEKLKGAWIRAIEQHTILRTSFVWEKVKTPVQVVNKEIILPWEELDWTAFSEREQTDKMTTFLDQAVKDSFDLAKAPLFRLILVRLKPNTFEFIFCQHHLILDGWSIALLLKEIVYNEARSKGLPYKDYIGWIKQKSAQEAAVFWKKELTGYVPVSFPRITYMEMPHQNSELQTIRKGFQLSETTTINLNKLLRKNNLTFSTLIQGCWGLLLTRYQQKEDVTFGVTISGRTTELEHMQESVGMFINTLPMRLSVPEDSLFSEWLTQIQNKNFEQESYSYCALTDIQSWSGISAKTGLFDSIVVFDNFPIESAASKEKLFGTEIVKGVGKGSITGYPITVISSASEDQCSIKLSYDTRVFSERAIDSIFAHLEGLLSHASQGFQQTLSSFPKVSPSEKDLYRQWNATSYEFPWSGGLAQMFEAQVDQTPEAVALVFEGKSLSYQALNEKANRLARAIRENYQKRTGETIKPDTLIGLYLNRNLEMLISVLAVLKAGGAYVPIAPDNPKERTKFILDDTRTFLVITEKEYSERLEFWRSELTIAPELIVADHSEATANFACANLETVSDSKDLAYAIYTSGTTGNPKGVLVEQHSVINHFYGLDLRLGKVFQRVDFSTNYCFDLSVATYLCPLLIGGTVFIYGHDLTDMDLYCQHLRENEIGFLKTTPSIGALIQTEGYQIETMLLGGERLTENCIRGVSAHTKRLFNEYGPTEATVGTTVSLVKTPYHIDIGSTFPNVRLYVLSDQLQYVPIGVPGELYIGGAGVARGYLNRAELTAERFIDNPFVTETDQAKGYTQLYKTGDTVRWLPHSEGQPGHIEFIGRNDHQVKIRGFRIELGEIEQQLLQHTSVKEAIVVAKMDQQAADQSENQLLVAYVMAAESSDTEEKPEALSDTLRNHLKYALPSYMIPTAIVRLEEMPLTANGKIDRVFLMEQEIEFSVSEEKVLPRNSMEIELKYIWEDVFKIKNIGMTDDFFDLGGNSFHAIKVISSIQKRFDRRLKLIDLLQETTIEKVAALINKIPSEEKFSHAVLIQPHGKKSPLFCVHPAGGHVYRFVDLANILGKEQPLVGLKSFGFDDDLEPHATYEEAATDYIKAVQEIQPEGPYNIIGQSCGGCIAYEMAQQLTQQGHEMNLVGLFDTYEPSQVHNNPISHEDGDPAVDLANMFAAYISGDAKEFMALSPEDRLDAVVEKIIASKRVPLEQGKKELLRLVETRKGIHRALYKYRPKPYDGRVDMFLALEGSILNWKIETLGWEKFASNMVIHKIPGPHDRMTQMPAVQILAKAVKSCLP